MKEKFFTKQEALEKVGKIIETLVDFASVPKGTTGTVTKATLEQTISDRWTVGVQ